MLANFLVPILSDGWRFIGLFAAATFLAALTGVAWLFWPMMRRDACGRSISSAIRRAACRRMTGC